VNLSKKQKDFSHVFLSSLLLGLFFVSSCQSVVGLSIPNSTPTDLQPPTPFQPAVTLTPPAEVLPQPLSPPAPLSGELAELKIDGRISEAEFDSVKSTWIWRDKKGIIRRVLDPLSGHVLACTSIGNDRLTYEIDYQFKWEVNLVNYQYYPTHAPFGTAHINLLKLKHPEVFTQANEKTGIIFRIIQTELNELQSPIKPVTILDESTEEERFFLSPAYLPASNEYLFVMGLKTDYLTRKGAINTYTEEMLNYCISSIEQGNFSGSWGIEVYKHAIK
jgi:hypothetical protein